ncbi:MAG: hypothetical protein AVDCRST_MAG95-2296 [uncultured Adhaeribacter sp.]|uniref:Uncharacterized protein n=1 Tax=uncultured Adhaeribacter sp. TaxID=448109 RepID=A0A6J4IVH7_9BACT|nr:MAG: hypothetical protein AVDCRST_MAG95-2296 [uncultured Adhaeribacter sp.]
MGYKNIPAFWQQGLAEAEPIDFKYTTMSLNEVYEVGYKHAIENIRRNGGKVGEREVSIRVQQPQAVPFEESFAGHHPVEKRSIGQTLKDEYTFNFEGIGFVLRGEVKSEPANSNPDYVAKAELYLDGKLLETINFPANFTTRRHDLFWKYQLPKGKHTARIKLLNPSEKAAFRLNDLIVYADRPQTAAK